MHIPARILRKHAMDIVPSLRNQTERESQREEIILKAAASLIARFGLAAITFTNLAVAIKIAPSTMRKHFADLDALVGEIMRRHLQEISDAIGTVPRDAPNRGRLQRAAYIEATRYLGAPTEAHLILTTYRTILAEDERISVEDTRAVIGDILGGDNGQGTLHLLDCPCFDADRIEAMLAAAAAGHVPAPVPSPALKPPLPAAAVTFDLSDISGVEIPGGPLCQPRKPQPWDRPERTLSDAELHLACTEARAPPGALAA